MIIRILLCLLALFVLSCSSSDRLATATIPPWAEAYSGADPERAYQELLADKVRYTAIEFGSENSPNRYYRLGTEYRIFALAYYLDRPDWRQRFQEFTNSYHQSSTDLQAPLSINEALFNLEVAEYNKRVRWKTNTAKLARQPPSKAEVKEYVISIGKTNWLELIIERSE